MYGRLEEADPLVASLSADKDPILRRSGMYTLAMAYCGTGNNQAIRKLLHVAVSFFHLFCPSFHNWVETARHSDVKIALQLIFLFFMQKSVVFCMFFVLWGLGAAMLIEYDFIAHQSVGFFITKTMVFRKARNCGRERFSAKEKIEMIFEAGVKFTFRKIDCRGLGLSNQSNRLFILVLLWLSTGF